MLRLEMQHQSFYCLNTVSIITYYVENESLIIPHKLDRNLFHFHVMCSVQSKPADSSFFVWSKNSSILPLCFINRAHFLGRHSISNYESYILTDEVLMRPSSKLAQMSVRPSSILAQMWSVDKYHFNFVKQNELKFKIV